MNTRTETDSLGPIEVPFDAPRGIYTQRVLTTYPQGSDITPRVPEIFLRTYIETKMIYAKVNLTVGKLGEKEQIAIHQAGELLLGMSSDEFMSYFPLGQIQSGGGTSTNMMVNEVVANLASKHLGSEYGSGLVNSHDHLNLSQSSNDTFPGVMKLTAVKLLDKLLPNLESLIKQFKKHATDRQEIQKVGRTHLQDAVVISLGEEFGAYARTLQKTQAYIEQALPYMLELPLGGTATGSLQNVTPEIRSLIITACSTFYGKEFITPESYFEQNSSSSDIVVLSRALVHLSNNLIKIGNDLRLLSSGPLAGFGELSLPIVQPGSSIMPGKVNPSVIEAMTMICAKVIGNNETINVITRMAQLELQFLNPQIAWSLIDSLQQISTGIEMFDKKCVRGIEPNFDRISELLEGSFAYATDYSEKLGYETVARLVKKALKEKVNLRNLLEEAVSKIYA